MMCRNSRTNGSSHRTNTKMRHHFTHISVRGMRKSLWVPALMFAFLLVLFATVVPPGIQAETGTSDTEVELKHDGGTARDFTFISACPGGGYLVDFNPPDTPFAIKKVRIYGILAGTGWQGRDFEVEIWDKDKNVLHNAAYPVTKFLKWPAAKWVEIEIPDIEVTDKFYVHVYTGTGKQQGIHVGADDSVTNEHSTLTSRVGQTTKERPWSCYPSEQWFARKSKVNWMIRVVGVIPAQTEPQASTYDYEYLLSDQVVDVLSPREAHITWTLIVKNNTLQDIAHISYGIQSPIAALTVAKAYDEQGDINFRHLVGPPIPCGDSTARTLRLYFRRPLTPGETYKFTMELDAVGDEDLDFAYAFSSTDKIYRKAYLEVIAPPGYAIDRTEPAQANKLEVGNRESVAIEAEDIKELRLVAYFSSVEAAPPASSPPGQEASETGMGTVPFIIPANIAALLAGTAVLLWFFVISPWREKQKGGLARTREDYERKLAEWEREGYDVTELRDRWFKSHED